MDVSTLRKTQEKVDKVFRLYFSLKCDIIEAFLGVNEYAKNKFKSCLF